MPNARSGCLLLFDASTPRSPWSCCCRRLSSLVLSCSSFCSTFTAEVKGGIHNTAIVAEERRSRRQSWDRPSSRTHLHLWKRPWNLQHDSVYSVISSLPWSERLFSGLERNWKCPFIKNSQWRKDTLWRGYINKCG